MKEISRFCYSKKYSTAASEDSEGEKRKSLDEGWYGHRRASTGAVSSQSPVAGARLQCRALSERAINGQGKSSPAAAPHVADVPRTSEVKVKEIKPISALSDQQSAGMSTGARPKQRPQSVTRETVLQAVPALSDPEEAGDSEWVLVMPALPQQLSEKGYRLIDTKPLSKGTAQLVYLLAGEAKDGFERSYFVVKFPCEASRARALQGLEIQEKLARLEDGDQYFVPVIEKVMENGQLICHVEPIGVPVMTHIDVEGLDLTQVFGLICRMLVAVGTMHAQGIAHLDIKPDNLILETPDVETDMTARFCGFVRAVESDGIYTPVVIPVDTCTSMCASVPRQVPCSPVMADLWAFTFTAWALMAADIPALHWLEGVWRCTERRNQVFPELAICFSLSGWDCISGREIFSDDKCVKYGEALLDCLRCHKGDEKILGQLQCFFWDNFKFPADIDSLGLSPAEKHILKEMLSIMFLPSDYDDRFGKMMTLLPAALSCVESFLSCSALDKKTAMELIKKRGYQPCKRNQRFTGITQLCQLGHSLGEFCGDILAESAPINGEQYQRLGDFIMRKQRTLTRFAKQEAVDRTDVEDMLIDYLAEQGTLELLEEKNDSQLFGWLMTEWETRCRLQIFSHRLGQVC